MRAVVPLGAISKHCPCKAGWVHICDTLSDLCSTTNLQVFCREKSGKRCPVSVCFCLACVKGVCGAACLVNSAARFPCVWLGSLQGQRKSIANDRKQESWDVQVIDCPKHALEILPQKGLYVTELFFGHARRRWSRGSYGVNGPCMLRSSRPWPTLIRSARIKASLTNSSHGGGHE
jgi:hypothetical protein